MQEHDSSDWEIIQMSSAKMGITIAHFLSAYSENPIDCRTKSNGI
jgi:hypothetical protein